MIREPILTISTLLALMALMALSGAAYAGPGITDKSYWPNEPGPSSYKRSTQTEPDPYRARAMVRGRTPVQAAPQGNTGQDRCRYQGGAHSSMSC